MTMNCLEKGKARLNVPLFVVDLVWVPVRNAVNTREIGGGLLSAPPPIGLLQK